MGRVNPNPYAPPPVAPAGGAWRTIDKARIAQRGPTYHDAPSSSVGGDPNARVNPLAAPVTPTTTGGGAAPDPGGGQKLRNAPPGTPPNATGTESGPGILEQWFNMRANGTDPAFEYASKRGMETLGNRYGAAGMANSGAARQGESDFMANLTAQRMGQLDTLAGGASGEHQNRTNSMFNQGLGLANGESGLASAYDIGAANLSNNSFMQQMMMELNKAGVDSKAAQGIITNLMSIYGLSQMGGGKK